MSITSGPGQFRRLVKHDVLVKPASAAIIYLLRIRSVKLPVASCPFNNETDPSRIGIGGAVVP